MTTSQNSYTKDLTGFPLRDLSGLTCWDGALAAITGSLALVLYLRTLAPGLLPGDSGEFQTLAYLLGDTHPTGYSVYLLLAKLFTWLPVGDISYRVNLFSAVMAALAVAGTFLVGRLLTGRRWPALFGALALAVSPTFWSQALIAEIYTAGVAFVVAILLALLLWETYGRPRDLFIAGVLGGLSLGVHFTAALLAPAVGAFLLVSRRWNWSVWRPALWGALVGVGLAFIAFLIVDMNAPPANYFDSVVQPSRSAWDLKAADLDSPFERLAFGISARQFRPFMFADPGRVMPQQAREYRDGLSNELSPLAIVLAGLGVLGLLACQRRLALLLLLALTAQWLYTFNYTIWDLYVFHIPSYVFLVLLAAAGAGWLAEGWRVLARRWCGGWTVEVLLAAAVLTFGVRPVLASYWGTVIEGKQPFDFDEYPVNEFSLNLLHPLATAAVADLPENAIVFTDWDMLYPFYYVAHIEQGRTDLIFIETFPRDDTDALAESVLGYVQAQLGHRPVLFSERLSEIQEAGYRFGPFRAGPTRLYRVLPAD